MAYRFNPPPGWPAPEPGWTPPEGWTPDPSWPPAPEGWEFWVQEPDLPPPPAPPVAPVAGQVPPAATTGGGNGFGVAALVLGILGCLFGIVIIPFFIAGPLGLIGLVLGVVGLIRIGKGQAGGKGVTVAGVVLSAVALVLSVIGFIVVVAVLDEAGESLTEAVEQLGEGRPGVSASCQGQTYAGQLDRDVCADASGVVTVDDMRLTATPLEVVASEFGSDELCTTVTVTNGSDESASYNELDFTLVLPSGDTQSLGFSVAGDLGSGELTPGATKSGKVCTDDTAETGRHVLIYKPGTLFGPRGIVLLDR